LLSAALVFLMQAGFLCLESGLTRNKNNINVAMKNVADFCVTTVVFWAVGFALMFGASANGVIGSARFLPDFSTLSAWDSSFFIFQVMFCGTAVTIMSGAVAERLKFNGYLFAAILTSAITYPVFGHWAWNGFDRGEVGGWLAQAGFVDFAGSTVVHGVGGWTSLAVLLIIGARRGRFRDDGTAQKIPASNMPLATIGVLLLFIGWMGFNGGSTLAMNDQVPWILANTIIAGSTGMIAATLAGLYQYGRPEVTAIMNGCLAGLVAITAGAHAVSTSDAAMIGAVGGLVMLVTERLLERLRIDDAVGAIPVHLAAGIWGTLAVGIFGIPEVLGSGLSRGDQIVVQAQGIALCGLWVFSLTFIVLWLINRIIPLRVSPEHESIGLNIAEHGETDALSNLFLAMDEQSKSGDLSIRVPVEPFTEAGQIAERYNNLMDSLEETQARVQIVFQSATDSIMTFDRATLEIDAANPATATLFGYDIKSLVGRPVTDLLALPVGEFESEEAKIAAGRNWFTEAAAKDDKREIGGRHVESGPIPIEIVVRAANLERREIYICSVRDIADRKQAERKIRDYLSRVSTPVTQVWQGILLLPVVGMIDKRRYHEIMDAALQKIASTKAKIFIVDISGVENIDASVIDYLLKITRGADLMGCQCIVSGLTPQVAMSLVDLGADADELRSATTMREALAISFREIGIEILASIPPDHRLEEVESD
jgi:Amt family ammonium transporter